MNLILIGAQRELQRPLILLKNKYVKYLFTDLVFLELQILAEENFLDNVTC